MVPSDSIGEVVYFLRPRNEHFDVNRTSGMIYVIKDLTEWKHPQQVQLVVVVVVVVVIVVVVRCAPDRYPDPDIRWFLFGSGSAFKDFACIWI